jgi:hypothetical protein
VALVAVGGRRAAAGLKSGAVRERFIGIVDRFGLRFLAASLLYINNDKIVRALAQGDRD